MSAPFYVIDGQSPRTWQLLTRQMVREIGRGTQEAMREIGAIAVAKAQELAPKFTGEGARSIRAVQTTRAQPLTASVRGLTVAVGPTEKHMSILEGDRSGTARRPGAPTPPAYKLTRWFNAHRSSFPEDWTARDLAWSIAKKGIPGNPNFRSTGFLRRTEDYMKQNAKQITRILGRDVAASWRRAARSRR